MKRPIAKAWESYAALVMPKTAGDVQRDETRKAFYAGASVLFRILLGALEPGADPTEHDLAVMDEISAEIDAFGEGLDADVLSRLKGKGGAA